MPSDRHLLDALRDCYDPRTRRNLVAAGLVRSATLVPDEDAPGAGIPGVPVRFVAHIQLFASGPDEEANHQLEAQVSNRLAGLEWISRSEVNLHPPLFPIL